MPSVKYILVADDEMDIAGFVSDALRDEGYRVDEVHDGASALLAVQEATPDLLLLDNAMPVMTGAEVLHRLRSRGVRCPIIVMSANTRADQFVRAGATAFLAKPFTLDELLRVVERHLR